MSRNPFSLIRHLVMLAESLLQQDEEDGLNIYTLEGLHIEGHHYCVAERTRLRFDMAEKKPKF